MADRLVGISFVAVSSRPQVDEVSLEHQHDVNLANAAKLNVHIPVEHCLSVPGHTREYDTLFEIMVDVEAYRQLWDIVSNRRADVLFVYMVSRLGRTESLVMDVARKCWRHDVALYVDNIPPQSLDARLQRRDMAQRLMLAFSGVQSSEEIEKLRDYHRTGMYHRVTRKGLDSGKLRYGYVYEYQGKKRRKVIDTVAADIIRFILLDLYVGQKLGQRAILRILNAQGAVTPSRRREQVWNEAMPNASDIWYPGTVSELIRCARHYAGYLEYNRTTTRQGYDTRREHTGWIKAKFPAIFTEDEILAIETERDGRSVGPRRVYPLSGLCVCAECGQWMHGNLQRKRYWAKEGKHYRYMRCRECRVYRREDEIADALTSLFEYIENTTDISHLYSEQQDDELSDTLKEIERLYNEADSAEAAMNRLTDALAAGIEIPQIYDKLKAEKARNAEAETAITELQTKLRELRNRPTPDESIAEIRAEGRRVVEEMIEFPETARAWLGRHIDHIKVPKDGDIQIYLFG